MDGSILTLTPRADIVFVANQSLSGATALLVDPQHKLWAQNGVAADTTTADSNGVLVRFLEDIMGPSLAHDQRLSQGRRRQSSIVCYLQCTSPAAGEQWRWHQYLYQAQSWTASRRCSSSRGCRSLVPIPEASWLDLWAWDHDGCHGQELHPCPDNIGSEWSSPPSLMWSHCSSNSLCQFSHQLNSFLTSRFPHLNYDARCPSSLAECFADQGCRLQTGISGSSLPGHSNSTLSSLA